MVCEKGLEPMKAQKSFVGLSADNGDGCVDDRTLLYLHIDCGSVCRIFATVL